MQQSGNLDSLIERVKKHAGEEAEKIVNRAQKVAEREKDQAREKVKKHRMELEKLLQNKTESRRRATTSEIAILEKRMIMKKHQEAVDTVFTRILDELSVIKDTKKRKDLLVMLIREAVEVLQTSSVRVSLNATERDLALKAGLPSAVDFADISIEEKTVKTKGGPVVSDQSGRLLYENTFEAHLERNRNRFRTIVLEALGLQAKENS